MRDLFTLFCPAGLYSWGVGTQGQLGHAKIGLEKSSFGEDFYIQVEPRRILKSRQFKSVAIGGTYTLALNDTGECLDSMRCTVVTLTMVASSLRTAA